MPFEGLAALGLAASILQVIDFSAKLLSSTREIHMNGSTIRNSDLELIATDLKHTNEELKHYLCTRTGPSTQGTQDEQDLYDLSERSSVLADELLTILATVKPGAQVGRIGSVQTAIKTAWKKSRIDDTNIRLEAIRNELQFRILISMKLKLDAKALEADDTFQHLTAMKRSIIMAIMNSKQDTQLAISNQTVELLSRQKEWHDATMSAIHRRPHHMSAMDTHQRILDFLEFSTMSDRHEEISERHKDTFDWILDNGGSKIIHKAGGDFARWLRRDSGLYWISGKAGSGKSTLVKFLESDDRTHDALKAWAGRDKLVIASFYFWRAGTILQKSQAGLLRSILYSILEQCIELSSVLFPKHGRSTACWDEFPTINDLKRAFRHLAIQDVANIVLLVDGLDEFEGTDATLKDLIQLFEDAVSCPRIKVILSSRPLESFEVAFANSPKLRLHELTHKDITNYVHDKFVQHPDMMQISAQSRPEMQELADEIVTSASGVFLWVSLVVASLSQGLHNCDTISDLHQRLRELPRDLGELFGQMLRNVDPRYKVQSSRLFQIIRLYNEQPLKAKATGYRQYVDELEVLKGKEDRSVPLSPAMLFYAGLLEEDGKTPSMSLRSASERIATVVRTRCAGLIEIRSRPGGYHHEKIYRFEPPGTHIEYIHRSVFDFMQQVSTWKQMVLPTEGTGFNARACLVQVAIRLLEGRSPMSDIGSLVEWVCTLASGVTMPQEIVCSLRDLDRLMEGSFREHRARYIIQQNIYVDDGFTDIHWSEFFGKSLDYSGSEYSTGEYWEEIKRHGRYSYSFLCFAIQNGLAANVQDELERNGQGLHERNRRPLLDFACEDNYLPWVPITRVPILQIIIESGGDPNQSYRGISPWQTALYNLLGYDRRCDLTRWFDALECLVLHGADPHAFIGRDSLEPGSKENHDWRYSALFVVRRIVHNDFNWESSLEYLDCRKNSKVRLNRMQRERGYRLVKLLEERKAREEVWHRVKDGERVFWIRHYPISSTGQGDRIADENFAAMARSYVAPESRDVVGDNHAASKGGTRALSCDTLSTDGDIASEGGPTTLRSDGRVENGASLGHATLMESGKRRMWRSLRTMVSLEKRISP